MPTDFITALSTEFSDIADTTTATRVTARLLMAVLLGGIVGFERQITGKSAGARTHMLVALGSALFVLAPLEYGAGSPELSRVVQGLVAGIGFLGAGAIVHTAGGKQNKGLTTAAGIWTTAALGMTCALGRNGMAIAATVLAVAILHILPGGKNSHRDKPDDDQRDDDSNGERLPAKIPDPANPASLRTPK